MKQELLQHIDFSSICKLLSERAKRFFEEPDYWIMNGPRSVIVGIWETAVGDLFILPQTTPKNLLTWVGKAINSETLLSVPDKLAKDVWETLLDKLDECNFYGFVRDYFTDAIIQAAKSNNLHTTWLIPKRYVLLSYPEILKTVEKRGKPTCGLYDLAERLKLTDEQFKELENVVEWTVINSLF